MTSRASPKQTDVDVAALIRESFGAVLARGAVDSKPTLEEFFVSPEYCNFPGVRGGVASPAQLALIRAADGQPTGLCPDAQRFHFGIAPADHVDAFGTEVLGTRVTEQRPRQLVVRTGVRAAKSLIAALAALCYGALYSDLSGLRPGEVARGLIVAPRVGLAFATFRHALGTMQHSPKLAKHLVRPGMTQFTIKRDDGREVEIAIVAASSGGTNLRSTWLIGCVFDEADFHDDEDAAVNLKENIEAVTLRMVPSAQVWVVSSPWVDSGQFHGLMVDYLGAPKHGVLAFHSDSRSMNPMLPVDDEQKMRARDPERAAREFDAIPMSSSGSEFFPLAAIRACVNEARVGGAVTLPTEERTPHWGGADLAFRKNSSALALARYAAGRAVLAHHEEHRPEPGAPLKPSEVCKAFAIRAHSYRCNTVKGDIIYAETAREEFAKHRNAKNETVAYEDFVPTQESVAAAFTEFRRRMLEGLLELPNDPRLLLQIERTKSKALPGGRIQIILPKIGHTHGDTLMAVVLACIQVPLAEPTTSADWGTVKSDSRWAGMGRGF